MGMANNGRSGKSPWNICGLHRCRSSGEGQQLVHGPRQAGVQFRGDIIVGVGGNQAMVEDPSGNPIELFEPTRAEARLNRDPTC
jgi:hypothetical protein